MQKKKGFTLVELIAVVVVLAIIISLAVPAFSKIQKSVRKKQYENKKDLIKVAALKYADDTNYTSFYIDDLIINGYLEADKIVKKDSSKLYLEIDDHEGEEKIMNCYIVTIQDKNGVLSADIKERIDEGNENYEENEGCAINLPNSVNEYFDITLKEDTTTEKNEATGLYEGAGAWNDYYRKYNEWWTKNNVKITINGKNGNEVKSIEWYEGASLDPIKSNNPNYIISNNSIEIGKNVGSVLQQNYTAKIKMNGNEDNEYAVTTRVYIDRVAPEYYQNSNVISDKWTKSIEYAINAYDNESGLYSYFIKPENEVTTCPNDKNDSNWTGNKRKKITENGNYYACLIDNVGNVKQSDLLEFNNIDNSKLMCNIQATGNVGNAGWYIGGTNKAGVTVTVTPKTDGGYSIGPSGFEIGINDKIKTWPEKVVNNNAVNKTYDKVDPYEPYINTEMGSMAVPYDRWYNDAINRKVLLFHTDDTSGKTYFGHIANPTGENKVCAKNIKYEYEIKQPSIVVGPSYTSISLTITPGASISGTSGVTCYRTDGSNKYANPVNATKNTLGQYVCTYTFNPSEYNQTYTFTVRNTSVAGNYSETSVNANVLGYCHNGTSGTAKWSPVVCTPNNVCVANSTQTGSTTCYSTASGYTSRTCPNTKGECGTKPSTACANCTNCGYTDTGCSSSSTCSDKCGEGGGTGTTTTTCTGSTSTYNNTTPCGGHTYTAPVTNCTAGGKTNNGSATETKVGTCPTACGQAASTIKNGIKVTQPTKSTVDGSACTSTISYKDLKCSATEPCYCNGDIDYKYWASNQSGSVTTSTVKTCSKSSKPSSVKLTVNYSENDEGIVQWCQAYIKQSNFHDADRELFYKSGDDYKSCGRSTSGTTGNCIYYKNDSGNYANISGYKTPGANAGDGKKYGNIVITVYCNTNLQQATGGYRVKGGLLVS